MVIAGAPQADRKRLARRKKKESCAIARRRGKDSCAQVGAVALALLARRSGLGARVSQRGVPARGGAGARAPLFKRQPLSGDMERGMTLGECASGVVGGPSLLGAPSVMMLTRIFLGAPQIFLARRSRLTR
jgi:hypothetical protein